MKSSSPVPRNATEAIALFEETRSIPESFLFSMPGDLAHVAKIKDAHGNVKDVQLRLGQSQKGCVVSASVQRYGGMKNALAVLRWVARRCGLVIRSHGDGLFKGSIRGTRPRAEASGVAGIHFEWQFSGESTILHVVASIPATEGISKSATERTWSTEKWGRCGALEEAIKARLAIGAVPPDVERLSARLEAFYQAGPTRVVYSGKSRKLTPAVDNARSMAS